MTFVFRKTLGEFMRWLGFRGDPKRPRAVRGQAGWTRTTGPYGDLVECDTLRCCHCAAQWEVVVGSGRQRGFCSRCYDPNKPGSGYVCGHPLCMAACVPFEQQLENEEAGRPRLHVPPVKVLVPAELPRPKLILPE